MADVRPGETGDAEGTVMGSETHQVQASRFEVLRPYAEGALGVVHLARDTALGRDVALKRIREQHREQAANHWRFVLEAQVTGRLEHPGIVPVYAFETLPDGTPQYAMRLIRGTSLRDAIDKLHGNQPNRNKSDVAVDPAAVEQPTQRLLLGRFVDVCQAIGFANSRGVIHRDIKPDNIMLGPFGETLVVDWGMAKVIGGGSAPLRIEMPELNAFTDTRRGLESSLADSQFSPAAPRGIPGQAGIAAQAGTPGQAGIAEQLGNRNSMPHADDSVADSIAWDVASPTVDGGIVGTPAYMSPEQACGDAAAMSTASDIYSLGATLYHLITGRPPHSGRSPAILAAVRCNEVVLPRSVNPSIDKQLAAICTKAMSTDPVARYATATELAADVERYLADEPVTAHQDSLATKSVRFARRHRAWTLSGIAALALVAMTSTASALVVNHFRGENQRIALENKNIAETNARTAETNAQIAAEKTELAASERVAKEQATAAAEVAERQKRLTLMTMTRMLGSIDAKLRDVPSASPIRQRVLATVLEGFSQMQGDFGDDQPDLRDSIRRFRSKTLRQLAVLAMETGNTDAANMIMPAKVDAKQAEDAKQANDTLEQYVLSNAKAALGITEQVLEDRPGDPMAIRDQSESVFIMARSFDWAKRYEEAIEFGELAVSLSEQLVALKPDLEPLIVDLNSSLHVAGSYYAHAGKMEQAKEQYTRANELVEEYLERNPESLNMRRQLAAGYSNTSIVFEKDDPQRAIEMCEQAVDILRELFRLKPESGMAADDFERALFRAGSVRYGMDDWKLAGEHYKEESEVLAALINQSPNNGQLVERMATCLFSYSKSLENAGEPTAALDQLRRIEQIAGPFYVDGSPPESIKPYLDYAASKLNGEVKEIE